SVRDSNGVVGRYLWERRGKNTGTRRLATGDRLDALLEQLGLEHTLVCGNRKQFPGPLLRGGTLAAHISSAIVVPLQNDGKAGGVLALTARTPRVWTPDAVQATESIAHLLAAALERMASHSSVAKEQEARVRVEAA